MFKPIHKKFGLVVQGGTLRTIFTAGVLDAFISLKYNPFRYAIGVSGGAMCMVYYLTKQYNSTYKIMHELANDDEFMNWLNMFSEEEIVAIINNHQGGKFTASLLDTNTATTCSKGKQCCQKTGKSNPNCDNKNKGCCSSANKQCKKK